MSLADLLNDAEMGEEDSDDDADFDEGAALAADAANDVDDDDDEAEEEDVRGHARLPLHAAAARGDVDALGRALAEGAASGRVTWKIARDEQPARTVAFDLDEADHSTATPLHTVLLVALEVLSLIHI